MPSVRALFETLEPRQLLAATTLRIDSGGNGFTESSGKVWGADRGFTAGAVAVRVGDVTGTTSDGLFNSYRAGNFSYALPIKSGDYRVRLLLMDPTHTSAGQRKFDVFSERKLVLNDFDIASVAGGSAAVIKTFTTKVRDGRLNLWFTSVRDAALVSGIEVTRIATTLSFKPLAAAPLAKFESMGEVVNGKLYVFGGYINPQVVATAQVASYDPATNRWTTPKDMPEKLTHSGTASDGNFIYLAGGYVGDWKGESTAVTRHVWRYDTVHDAWTQMLSLPLARSAGALVRVGRKLHFFGGVGSDKQDRGEHWTLDLRRPTRWISAPAMPNPRNHLGYIEAGGKIYAIGGQHDLNESSGNDAQVDAFDVVTNTWKRVANLPRVTSHVHNATLLFGGKPTIAGGSTTGEISVADVLQYDAATNRWHKLGVLPQPLSAATADLLGTHIIVTGGTSSGSKPTSATWISA